MNDMNDILNWLKTRRAWATLMIVGWSLLIVRFSLPNDSEIGITANIMACLCFLLSFVHNVESFRK
jgi:hypothetical protein